MRIHIGARSNVVTSSLLAILAAAFAFGALGGSAVAAAPVHENTTTFVAGLSSTDCIDQAGCTITSLTVNASGDATIACLEIVQYPVSVGEPAIVEQGCGAVAQGAFTFDARNLSGATLSSTTVTLQALTCDAQGCQPTGGSRDVAAAATFTGIGDVSTFRANAKTTFGDCTMYFVGKGSSRNAQASANIDGRSITASGFLATSTEKLMVICH